MTNMRNIATAMVVCGLAIASCTKTHNNKPPVFPPPHPGPPPVTTPTVTPSTGFDFSFTTPAVKDSPVHFTATITGAAPTSYLWTFGDGTTSTLAAPSHAYTEVNNFNVTLVINNDATKALTKSITVNKDPKYTYLLAGTKSYHHTKVFHSMTGGSDSTVTYADTLLTITYVNPLAIAIIGDTLSYMTGSTEDALGFYKMTVGAPVVTRYLLFDRISNTVDYQIDYGDIHPYITEKYWR